MVADALVHVGGKASASRIAVDRQVKEVGRIHDEMQANDRYMSGRMHGLYASHTVNCAFEHREQPSIPD